MAPLILNYVASKLDLLKLRSFIDHHKDGKIYKQSIVFVDFSNFMRFDVDIKINH